MNGKNSSFSQERSETYNKMDPFELEENESVNFLEKSNRNTNSGVHSLNSSRYISHKSFSRYNSALKHLLPFRRKKNEEKVVQIDEAGCFSIISFSWMTKYIIKAYKKGLTIDDIPLCSPLDSCEANAQRLESLWQNELVKKGPVRASFGRAIWKFVRTRVLISSLTFLMSCLMGFISPAICMRNLLAYLEEPNANQTIGIIWALALTGAEILRVMFFAIYYSLSYRTALRLRSACLTMVFKKVLRLNSARNTSTGEIINLFSFDGPRLYYMIVYGPMAIGGPIISLCGFIYIYLILGPWALLGMIIFILYYPIQYLISHLSGYYKQKCVEQSDKRIKLMTEILMSIKLIKMYAWENWFSSQIYGLRKKELKEVQKIAYCQSIGIALAPTIPVISGIAVFLTHVMFGGNLVAAQAFSVLVFLTKQMKTSIQVIRDGSLSFYEGIISVKRFKAFSILSFASRHLRTALTQLHLGSISAVQGLKALPRFKVYTIMVILRTQLRVALTNARYGIDNFTQGRIIFNRLQDVFMIEENSTVISNQLDNSLALSIKNGFFSWDVIVMEPEHLKKKRIEKREIVTVEGEHKISEVLFSIDLRIRKGALIGICGPVGAGKSSLLLACLGQLKMTSGEISRLGTCAYVSQQSWIENTTLKENILFGRKFDTQKYKDVLKACALDSDLNFLPGGDDTEVGERGVTLSGGQKQRVALARALYSERDIYFLDDPLSAVDPSVGNQIFRKYILEGLSQKTVILVTSQIQFLQECDEILVIKEGRIVERGTYKELLSGDNEFVNIMKSGALVSHQQSIDKIVENQNLDEFQCSKDTSELNHTKVLNISGRKLLQEKQIQGTIKASTYRAYIAAAGGYSVCFFVMLVILINVGSNVFSSWWLAMWIKAGSGNTTIIDSKTNETIISQNINDNPALSFYMKVYASIIVLIVATCVIRGFVYTKVSIRASRVLHEKLFKKILDSPMIFFERTPIGQIQNLFARDMDEIESRLPESVEAMVQNIWVVIFSFLSITLVFHWFAIPLLLLACLYYFISKIFRVAIRDLKRMESISRAPVFSSISATIQGLSLIHAFNKENDYVNQFCKIFNKSSTNFYLSNNAMRWLAVRLDLISVAITFITSFLVAFLKGEVAPAYAGLALTYSAQICGVLQFTIRLLSENEARFISVERIQNNIEKLKSEGNSEQDVNVPSEWPSKGSIDFEEVKFSYEENLPYVLNNISISISGGEKIGVVGRTGAGKSSLIAALFRLVEVSSGKIYIDGVNIARVPLSILRSRLSVIPQDPTLFSESLRSNLDPYNIYDDNTLWDVLEKTRLLKKVKSMPKEMFTYVGEGENLSVGEKQLVCLARTLLRHSKILILDEATASIDPETETAIQTVIENEFRNCTVITIAHRLSTVTNCNRVLVIEQGMVVEFDNPEVLMKNPNSQFAKMLAGLEVHKWQS